MRIWNVQNSGRPFRLPMHKAAEDFFREDTLVVRAVAELISSKLAQQGVRVTQDIRGWVEAEVRKRFLNEDGLTWDHPFIGNFEGSHEIQNISIDETDFKTISEQSEQMAASVVEVSSDRFFLEALNSVRNSAGQADARREDEIKRFRKRLESYWREPLELLTKQRSVAMRFGEDMTYWLRSQATASDSELTEALLRLHARACQIAGEIEVLLRAGFSDGALARWRTLHEVSIVALFLQQQGNAVAKRYIDHLAVDAYDSAQKFVVASTEGQISWISDREMEVLRRDVEHQKDQYGKDFVCQYGWASEALGLSRPDFVQIEKAVQFDRLRPYYKLASNTVHAGPGGAFQNSGQLGGASIALLAGPSNAGLAEAGRLTAMSLTHVSSALMLLHTVVDGVVWMRVMTHLASETADSFLRVERRLAASEGLLLDRSMSLGKRLSRRTLERGYEKPSERLRRMTGR